MPFKDKKLDEMGSSESKQEIQYNDLLDKVKQWDEEVDATQMEQIESFHKSIVMRATEVEQS